MIIDDYRAYPTRIECNDTTLSIPVFSIEAADESGGTVEIDAVCNVREWDKISPIIRQALLSMQFDGDLTE